MAIRVTCKSCKTVLTFNDDKAGKKVACKKCEQTLTLPGAASKRDAETAVQEKQRVKVKAKARDEDDDRDNEEDDDEDDRPRRGKAKKKSGSGALVLAIGGGVLALLVLVGGGGAAAYFLLRSPAKPAAPAPMAKEENADPDAAPGKKGQLALGKKKADAVAAIPKIDPNAPMAERMSEEMVARVKQATVYLRVHAGNGLVGTGSGFLAVEPELIVTNAHVVGMMQASAAAPRLIEVFLNSGQPNEQKMDGMLLGVDRTSDLAVIRVNNKHLPPPLPIDAERKLTELQKCYVFGFPFGESLGKAITVTEAKVSSFRNDTRTNELDRIQLDGSMQPGNSGGPVLNANGSVIGVSVSIIKGTAINFAVPAAKIHGAMQGRASDTSFGIPYVDGGQTKIPIKVKCLDPLGKIAEVKVDVWSGTPGQPRPASATPPQGAAGDGPRSTHALRYSGGVATLEVPLPALAAGQVCWVQPSVKNLIGQQWGSAVPTPANLQPVERKPANLTIDYRAVKERTVKLKSSQGIVATVKYEAKQQVEKADLDLLEVVVPEPNGFKVRTAYGPTFNFFRDTDGQRTDANKRGLDHLRQLPPVFMLDGASKFLMHRTEKQLANLPPELSEEVLENYGQICNSIEAAMVPMPNRSMEPLSTWPAKVPMPLRVNLYGPKAKARFENFNLNLACTFEGVRTRNQRGEALISVQGRVLGEGLTANLTAGDVSGTVSLDIDGKFISAGQLKISQEIDTKGAADVSAAFVLDIDLDRQAGNPLNIKMPPESKSSYGPAGQLVFDKQDVMNASDKPDPFYFAKGKKSLMKYYDVKGFKPNQNYVVTASSDSFIPMVRMANPSIGGILGIDENASGGKEARFTYRAQTDTVLRVIVTARDAKTGQFHLTVHEAP